MSPTDTIPDKRQSDLLKALTRAHQYVEELCTLVNTLDRKAGGNGRKVRADDYMQPVEDALMLVTDRNGARA